MSADSVIAIAWDVFKNYVIAPVERGFGYMVSSKRFANSLRKEVQKLEDEAQRVNVLAEEAQHNVRNFNNVFTTWKESVGEALEEAQELLKAFDEESKTCCYDKLPNPKYRYQFSRKAECKIEVVKQLAQECSGFRGLDDISFIDPTPGNVAAPNRTRREGKDVVQSSTTTATKLGDDDVFESRASMIPEIMSALANKSVVGVHGLGGVGKSTLLADAEKKIREEKSFDWVVKADVSQNPSIKMIQEEIAGGLGITDMKKIDTINGRAELLRRRLEKEEHDKKKVLILLDNLWQRLDLNEVGIPCGHDNKAKGCKLLLTSRENVVLRREMGCDVAFALGVLEKEEAKVLFERIVGDTVDDEEFKPWVEVALAKCGGLPFLIVAIAKRLRNTELYRWRDTLKKINEFEDIQTNDMIKWMLQWSYDNLEEEEKSTLRLCVVDGTSKPSFENLLRYWVGLGLFGRVCSMEEARDRLRSHIRTLQDSSLLLDSEDVDDFKIHDLVCHFVESMASKDHPFLVFKDKVKSIKELLKDKTKSYKAICFRNVDMDELPQELDCPELCLFLLFTNNKIICIPDSLFNSMRKLMVLNLTGVRLTCSPLPCRFLENLQALCLDNSSLDNIAILGALKGLQILSFVNSDILQLPKEIGQLTKLILLDLSNCSKLQIIEPGVLGRLTKLEELYMGNSFDKWNAVDRTTGTNASLSELNNMKNLYTLYVAVRDPSILPEYLNLEKLTKYRIRIGGSSSWRKCTGSRILELKLDARSGVLKKEYIQSMLGKTDDLLLDELDGSKQSICVLSRKGFPKLKHLQVRNSPSIHCIIRSPSDTDLKMIESLLLKNLVNLEKICHSNISPMSFNTLKKIQVASCDKMEVLFPFSVVKGLPQLEEIIVVNCKFMCGIVEADDCSKVELYNLRALTLHDLPKIKNFFNARSAHSGSISDHQLSTQVAFFNGRKVSIPSLESLEIIGLPNLKEIWSDESPLELSNLRSLKVMQCESLSKVFRSRLPVQLRKLHTLTVKNCASLQEIFGLNGPSGNRDVDILSELTTLELDGLQSLRHVWSKDPSGIVSFNNLTKLEVYDCDNLEFLFFPSMVKSLAKLRDLTISNCKKIEAVITEEEGLAMETLETLAFRMLTNLRLRGLKSLTCFSRGTCTQEARNQNDVQSRSIALFNGEVVFPRLEALNIWSLDNLKFVFSSSMVKSLTQLKTLDIWSCEKMEMIIMEEEGLGTATSEILAFPMLTGLSLSNLGSLTCFSRRNRSQEAQIQDHNKSHSTALFHGEDSIPSLESLEMVGLPILKEIWSDESLLESSNLRSLKVMRCESLLKIFSSKSVVQLQKLHTLTVNHCASLQEIFGLNGPSSSQDVDILAELTTLELDGLQSLRHVWNKDPSGIVSFDNLTELKVYHCDNLEFLFFPSMVKSLTKLRDLTISNCEKIETVITEEEGLAMKTSETLAFPMLTNLRLQWLKSMTSFSCGACSQEARNQNHVQSRSTALFNGEVVFPRLEALNIDSLDNLKFVFSPSMVKSLTQLKTLGIWSCEKMEMIIMEEEGLGTATSETLAFPMLTNLRLSSLRSLMCFSRGKCSQEARIQDHNKSHSTALFHGEVAFPNLKTLYIGGINNIEKIWDNQVAAEVFENLKDLSVYSCNRLMNLVPACILMSLESLEVKVCGSLEVVFELEPLNPPNRYPVACFPLKKLKLFRLPELKCVWDNEFHHQDKFHSVLSIRVYGFPASVAKDLVQLEELMIEECGIAELIEKEEGLVPKIVFPKLSSLELKNLMELTCIYNETHALWWPTLKTLEIQGCNRVDIFASQPENGMTDDKQSLFLIEKGTFPNLEKLKLDLAKQMEIWNGHFYDEEFFCKLRVLELCRLSKKSPISICCFVESLTKLEEFVVCESHLEEASSNEEAIGGTSHELKVMLPFLGYARHLQSLVVSYYEGLSIMFTSTVAENLVVLKKLRISNCKMLTEVISAREDEKGRVVAFNKLEYMELDGLIELRCFSLGGYALMFPVLEDVVMNGCPKMKFFSKGPIEAPKLERLQVALKDLYGSEKFEYFWNGNLNITIQNMFGEMATIAGAKSMWLSDFPELIEKWHNKLNPIKSSWQLESLVVDKCPSFINAIPSKLMLVLKKMRNLQVCDCELLEEIFDFEELEVVENTLVLPQLCDLNLVNLPRLRRLWNKDLQGMMSFSSLYYLNLYKCSNLRHVFAPSMARFVNLGWMVIKDCGKMEGVIGEEERQGSVAEKITFPCLQGIRLERLPNLTSFLSGNSHMLDCPKMEYLTIAHCPKMRSLTRESLMEIDHGTLSLFTPQVQFPQLAQMALSHMGNLRKIWTDDPQESLTFDHLRGVTVQNCRSLENLFPHWVATSLTQIQNLRVDSCGIEEIVTSGNDAPHSDATQVLFPELISLILHDMSRLKSFCPNLPTWTWPLLKELRVTHCDEMNMLSFPASTNKWTQKNDQRDLLDQEARSSFERDFPNLKRLCLVGKDVQMLQDGKFPSDIFSKIEALTLACFHDGNVVFPPRFLLERFQNLQSLTVLCSSFEDIFPDEELVAEEKHPMLENLRDLKLSKLHNLKRVWREDYLMEKILQRIKTFVVEDCPDLTIIFPSMTSFRNLTRLVLKNSSGLIHLVTTSAITNILHLTDMTIIGCEKLKEVVTNDGNGEGIVVSLGQLRCLTLQNLPSLVCFSSGTSCSFRFPSLRRITVEECPQMKFFSKGTLSTPKLDSGSLLGYQLPYSFERAWEGDLNRIIQKLSAETNVDESITD